MNKNFLIGIVLGMFVTTAFFSGMTSVASAPKPKEEAKADEKGGHGKKEEGKHGEEGEDAKKEEAKEKGHAKKKSGHGKEEEEVPEEPKVVYEYYPDVTSLDDLKDAILPDKKDNVKVVYETPQTCKEFSMYLESKAQKLERFEAELMQRETMISEMQKQLEESLAKFSDTETRVKKLVNADPSGLKDNPEVAKMVKLYEALSPEESAERLKNLDLDLTYMILKGMQPKKLSKIMSALDPKLSAALSSKLVRGF